jgi:hypothetical protein
LHPIVNRWRVAFVTTPIAGPLDLPSEFARSGSLLPPNRTSEGHTPGPH